MDRKKLERLGNLRQEVARLEEELGVGGGVGRVPEGAVGDAAYALIAKHARDMLSIHAANGDYLWVSPACESLLGYRPEALVGRNAYALFHPDDIARIAETHADQDGVDSQVISYRLRRADDTWVWVETVSHAHTMPSEHGPAIQQIVCITRDMTERMMAQDALLESVVRLEQFAAGAAHDLKGPLTTIVGYTELIALDPHGRLGDADHRRLGQIRQACNQLAGQIDGLLAWARSGREARSHSRSDLGLLVAEVLASLQLDIEELGAEVEIGALPAVRLDPALARVLLQNLLGNALKYHHPGRPPRIRVVTRQDADQVVFCVQDNGRGVPPGQRERIFGMFRRGPEVEDLPGHGVGLALCSRIADLNGGRIWVEDSPLGGASFCVSLPAVATDASVPRAR